MDEAMNCEFDTFIPEYVSPYFKWYKQDGLEKWYR